MHTLLGLSSVLLVLVGAYGALQAQRRLQGWTERRDLQLLALATPVLSLGLGIAGLHHFAGRTCFLGAPSWDYTLGIALPVAMGGVALGGLGLGLVRLVLMARVVRVGCVAADVDTQALADGLAERLGAPRPSVKVLAYDRPVALTIGLRRPTVLLSTWVLDHLDRSEIEAVLAHEIGHAVRRDFLVVWLATILRDAFFYLPTSWAAYRRLQREKELACDDLTVGVTGRPLALASALIKVWQPSLASPMPMGAQSIVGTGTIEGRIERLLGQTGLPEQACHRRPLALGRGGSALAGLLVLQALSVAVLLEPMGCGPISRMGTLM